MKNYLREHPRLCILTLMVLLLPLLLYVLMCKLWITNSILQGEIKTFDRLVSIYGTDIKLHPWWKPMYIYPIHLTCSNGKVDMVKILIEKEANIKVRDGWERTCLHHAMNGEDSNITIEILTLLLAKEPSLVSIQDESTGYFPLHLACYYKYDIQVIELLFKHGASAHELDRNGDTPLDLLIKSPVSPSEKDEALMQLIQSHMD